jgi:hypothetical protein
MERLMKYSTSMHVMAAVFFLLLVTPLPGKSGDAIEDTTIGSCEDCVATTDTNVLKGKLDAISFKASMLQLKTESGTKVIAFDDDTILIGIESFNNIEPESDLEIEYIKEDGGLLAVGIQVVAKEELLDGNQINAKTLSNLISKTTTPVTVIDARPDLSYSQGHIPGAVSIYNGVFDKNIDKLPVNKDQLIVYYCDGTA